MGGTPKLSIVIPAYNEERRIKKTLIKYHNYFSEKYDDDFEMIVVTDGCKDGTPNVVREFSREFPHVKHLNFARRLGKGGGIIQGFKIAEGEMIGFVDADCGAEPKEFDKLIGATRFKDGAIGSRWLNRSLVKTKEPFLREVGSRIFYLIARTLFGLTYKDTQCGAKVFRKQVVKDIMNKIYLTGFTFDLDLLYRMKRKNYEIEEVPISWKHQEGSKLNFGKIAPLAVISALELRVLESRFKVLMKSPAVSYILNCIAEGNDFRISHSTQQF
ncbi:MAG: glycosyltransferase family 2 protein [Actinobacteria bacterium]|nr:glycosyltransferase family 2 protein [Actinomycetota bacterium]